MIAALVVSDTSPLRALNHLGLVELLEQLFADVLVPPAVAVELAVAKMKLPALDLRQFPFIRVVPLQNPAHIHPYIMELDAGEAEAIALALEVNASHVLIDEQDGRNIAAEAGLTAMGVLGVLIEAKKAGLIGLVRPLAERLIAEINFHLSSRVLQAALQRAGE